MTVHATSPIRLAVGLRALRAAGLAATLVAVAETTPHPGLHGRALAVTICLAGAAIGWTLWMVGERQHRLTVVGLGVLAAAGGVLASVQPALVGLVFGTFAAFMAGDGLTMAAAIGVTLVAGIALAAGEFAVGVTVARLLGAAVTFAAGLFVGLLRAQTRQRADQAELLLAQTQRARVAEAESAALAERGRIAREIHDVLAHSLAALTVQLQAAHALLETDTLPATDPHLITAIGCVHRAEHLAREGMAEARRAIHALREDARPLPDLLATLVRDDHTHLSVTGTVAPLRPDATLAFFRTTQEALTNARKHAPGADVTVCLAYAAEHTEITVTNSAGDPRSPKPLTDTGTGYGLTGLRERAELAGGTLTAGPHADGWRVCVRIPR
jgi:signal transduction histidine kinase